MDAQTWTYILVILTFGIYIYIGYASRVKDTKGFYVAGQGVPAIANGAATAADWMSAASFISMAGLISVLGFDGSIYLMGWTGGYVLLALLLAPYLRKFGKYTVPDFVGDRYYSKTARSVAAIAAVFVSLTYVAGQMRGVGVVFSRFLGLDITWGVVLGMVIVAFFAVLGGMKGITWTQVAQYFVLIVAFLIPAVAISAQLTGNPIPQLSLVFSNITPRLNQIQLDLGFNEYTRPFANRTPIDVFTITVALMIGTAGLPHVIVRFYTVPNVRAARYSAGWALLFIALLYTTAPAVAVFARYNLLNTLNGAQIVSTEEIGGRQIINLAYPETHQNEDVAGQPIEWATSWQRTGLITFEDNGSGTISMQKAETGPGFAQAKIDNDIIVLSTPEVARLAPVVIALVAAGGLAAALSTASGLLLVISSAFSHDIYYRLINPDASEQLRLLVGRIVIFLGVIAAGYFGINPPGFVAEVVAFAFGLAAASFFPIIVLGIFDKRANDKGAISGMLVGLIFTMVMILIMRSQQIFGVAPLFDNVFGITAQGIGTVGAILNFVVSFVVSRSTEAPPQDIQDLVESVRVPRGAGSAAAH